ncbi:MGMT family protein [bacterium]|nr:MGMT family protein [bacterium]MBU1598906.1 MGMT family protein [bacterium]
MKELTPFQIKVYNVVSFIPYGETRSYSWVAKRIETSPRAIGKALSRNPLPIIIPCHTRVKKRGEIGGYIGGRELKEKILEIERK